MPRQVRARLPSIAFPDRRRARAALPMVSGIITRRRPGWRRPRPPRNRRNHNGRGGNGHPLGVARAQVHETYSVAQTADGIVVVDQHPAHERLTHERIKRAMENGGVCATTIKAPMETPTVHREGSRHVHETARTKLAITIFCPAFSKSIASLSPSTAVTMP